MPHVATALVNAACENQFDGASARGRYGLRRPILGQTACSSPVFTLELHIGMDL